MRHNVAEDGTPGMGSPFANAFMTEDRQPPWRQGDLPFDLYPAGMQSFPVP